MLHFLFLFYHKCSIHTCFTEYTHRDLCVLWCKHHESGLNHVLPSTHVEMYVFYVANIMSLD
jgi:hypothetical protein